MPAGASPKREREYEKLKDEFEEEGRYSGREAEVAARIVNKQRARLGETKQAKERRREGRAPDRNLPIRDYEKLTISQIVSRLKKLELGQIKQIQRYEKHHKDRKTLNQKLERALEMKA